MPHDPLFSALDKEPNTIVAGNVEHPQWPVWVGGYWMLAPRSTPQRRLLHFLVWRIEVWLLLFLMINSLTLLFSG